MFLEGEKKNVEYKLEYTKTFLKTVCAYANFHDGIIVFGIKDDGTVVGVDQMDALKHNIENAINDSILPKPYYELLVTTYEGGNILVVKVYKGDYTPYTYQNKAYMRRDTSTVQVDSNLYQNLIMAGRNLSFEDRLYQGRDLTFDVLGHLLKKQLKISDLSEDLLKTLGLLEGDAFNHAGVLLSDQNPLKSSVVQLVAFRGKNVNGIKDRATLERCSILEQFDACMDFYRKHINSGEVIDSAYRKTVEEVPLVAYREAVANMLVHRDYAMEVDARIEIFSDRIEIISPGGLPIGVLHEEFVDGRISKARNKKISDVFLRLRIIERLATGIRRIKEQYMDHEVKPKFLTTEHSVVIVLPFIQPSDIPKLEDSTVMETDFDRRDETIYLLIKKNPLIKRADIQKQIQLEKSQTIERINHLKKLGKIMAVGNGPATGYKVLE